jgi:hypothetical protein
MKPVAAARMFYHRAKGIDIGKALDDVVLEPAIESRVR